LVSIGIEESVVWIAILSLSGLAIGFVGGMVGLVLGVLRFPLIMGVEVSASIIAGTNIGISTLGAITAAIRHYHQNNIDFHIFLIMALAGAIGAFIGSFLTKQIPVYVLLAIIGIIVSYESFVLLRASKSNEKEQLLSSSSYFKDNNNNIDKKKKKKSFAIFTIESTIGFGVGFLGGIVGLVLGSIRMPAMISVLKMEPKIAIGTNLAIASFMGTFGLIGHLINNNVNYIILTIMGSTAMIGGYIGAKYTNRFSDVTLKRIIGIVLIAVALTMFWCVYLSFLGNY
jgi:uncharacterized membrane protein YfcA